MSTIAETVAKKVKKYHAILEQKAVDDNDKEIISWVSKLKVIGKVRPPKRQSINRGRYAT